MQTGELSLRDYVAVLRRRWPLIGGVSLALLIVGFVYSALQPSVYSAKAEVLVDFDLSAQITDPANQSRSVTDRSRRLENELRYADSDSVQAVAEDTLGRDAKATITADANADVIAFVATDTNAKRAAEEANAFARAYTSTRAERNAAKFTEAITSVDAVLVELRADLAALGPDTGSPERDVERASLQEQIQTYESRKTAYGLLADANKDTSASIINPAKPADAPIAPKPLRTAILAFTLGLLAATGIAFLLEFLDDRLRSKEDLEAVSSTATLALIPRGRDMAEDNPAFDADDSPLAEAFRGLRTSVYFAGLRQPLRSIQVTSANPNEGKTTVAGHLAVAMARLGTPVVLIDADLRNPSIHKRFQLGTNDQGLAAVLLGHASLGHALRGVEGVPNLWVLPSGPAPANPADFLWPTNAPVGTVSVPQVVDELVNAGYTVILDSPPILPVTDSVTLSRTVDGTVFVTRYGVTRARAVQRALEQLDHVEARVVGTVLNQASDKLDGYRYGYGYGHDKQGRPTNRLPHQPAATADLSVTQATVAIPSGMSTPPATPPAPLVGPENQTWTVPHAANGRTNGRVNPMAPPATNGEADLVGRLRDHLGVTPPQG